jgi:hypothetical protein
MTAGLGEMNIISNGAKSASEWKSDLADLATASQVMVDKIIRKRYQAIQVEYWFLIKIECSIKQLYKWNYG